MSKINDRNAIAQHMQEIPDEQLREIFEDIEKCSKTSAVSEGALREFAIKQFGSDLFICNAKEILLLEIARRYNAMIKIFNQRFWRDAKQDPPPPYEVVIAVYQDCVTDENGVEETVLVSGPVYRHEEGFTCWNGYEVKVYKWMPFPDDTDCQEVNG